MCVHVASKRNVIEARHVIPHVSHQRNVTWCHNYQCGITAWRRHVIPISHTQTANVLMTTFLVGYGACTAVHVFRRIATVVVHVHSRYWYWYPRNGLYRTGGWYDKVVYSIWMLYGIGFSLGCCFLKLFITLNKRFVVTVLLSTEKQVLATIHSKIRLIKMI